MLTKSIIDVPLEADGSLVSSLAQADSDATVAKGAVGRRLFTIRAADSMGQRSKANILVNRMYASRGYHTNSLQKDADSNRITLIAGEGDVISGTVTIGFDGPQGLLVDQLFRAEADQLRNASREACEFTKLAVDNAVKSRRVLASLFHVAYIIAHRLNGIHDLLIEINPRHVRYYERMLGFEVKGPERLNTRVNAPAVLLALDLSHARRQIEQFAGRANHTAGQWSLYPYFFAPAEEAGIINRLS